jgi:hypothetical protein
MIYVMIKEQEMDTGDKTMAKRPNAKKKVGRPRTGKRPVIALRVHQPLYDRITESAAGLKLTISEEAERRLERSFDWEKQFGNADKMLAEHRAALAGGFESAMRNKGYQRVRIDQGVVWAEPGMDISRMSVSVDAAAIVDAIHPQLVAALVQAFAKLKSDQQK